MYGHFEEIHILCLHMSWGKRKILEMLSVVRLLQSYGVFAVSAPSIYILKASF